MANSKYLNRTFCGYKVIRAKAAPSRHTVFTLKSVRNGKLVHLRDNALTSISRHEKTVSDYLD